MSRADRMRPVRAGVINLWDYTDHEFAFRGGRLVLRGPNGSGKTKALELLFPFLLDASIAPQRLDPFSGTGRTMRDNLLYRPGRDSVTGYAWMEFAAEDGTGWTIGAGLRAQRTRNEVTSWFFVTDQQLGKDWLLVDGDRQVLTARALGEAIGAGNVFDSARSYRDRVDTVLFGGIGPDRYAALMQLVLFLRKPQLAKDLDLRQLSETLSAGMRPVDDEHLTDGARSFDDLEAIQRELDRLERACDAATDFLRAYRPYVRVVARARADVALAAHRAFDAAGRAIAAASQACDAAGIEVSAAADALDAADSEQQRLVAEHAALLRSDAYKAIAQLEDLRRHVDTSREVLVRARAEFERARNELTMAQSRASEAVTDRERTQAASVRAFESMRASASGVVPLRLTEIDALRDHADPRPVALGVARERRLDVKAVERALTDFERAVADAERAEHEVAEAETRFDAANSRLVAAEADVVQQRQQLLTAVTAWAAPLDWIDAVGHTSITAHIGDAEPLQLRELLLGLAAPRRAELAVAIARLDDQLVATRSEIAVLEAERLRIGEERDEAPPAPRAARRDRTGVGGAPFWRLVDFSPHLGDEERAGLEAALLAAGMLDAWVSADGVSDGQALDSFLRGAPRPGDGPSLASVLVAAVDPNVAVDLATVATILESVSLDGVGVAVGTDGSFSFGPLHGRSTVGQAEFIGASARAARRVRRIAELDAQIAEHTGRLDAIDAARAEALSARQALDDAVVALPSTSAVTDALHVRVRAAADVTVRRDDVARRRTEAEAKTTRRVATSEALAAEGRRRSLPTTRDLLDQVTLGLDGFEAATHALGDARVRDQQAVRRADETAHQAEIRGEDAERQGRNAVGCEAEFERTRAELATIQDAFGVDAKEVAATLAQLDIEIAAKAIEVTDVRARRDRALAARVRAEADTERAQAERVRADAEVAAATARLTVLRGTELRAALGLDDRDDRTLFLSALDDNVRGVVASDERRQSTKTAVRNAFQTLETRLGSRYHASLEDRDDVDVAMVNDEDGRSSVESFAQRTIQRRDDHRTLLSEQERRVLEDTVIDTICGQLHQRLRDGEDQVRRMNKALAGRRTTSGKGVQLSWTANDDLSGDQKQIVDLLDRDPVYLGAERDRLREALAQVIRTARANDGAANYYEILSRVFDYRAWRSFGVRLKDNDGTERRLTKKLFNQHSGGEKATILHLPLFAAATAHFDAAAPHAPRLIALDEAFAGIDSATTRELLALTVEFDLDLFLTGHDFWGAVPEVPQLSIVALANHRDTHTVSALNGYWDGTVLQYE